MDFLPAPGRVITSVVDSVEEMFLEFGQATRLQEGVKMTSEKGAVNLHRILCYTSSMMKMKDWTYSGLECLWRIDWRICWKK